MRLFTVFVDETVTYQVLVQAESEGEAIDLARRVELTPFNEYTRERVVTGVEEDVEV